MDLRQALEGVSTLEYVAAAGPSQPAQVHWRAARAQVAAQLPPVGYLVRISGAAVNLPKVPWLAVLNPEVTTTAQSGLYIVYLYSSDLRSVFLTMNQGATAHYKHHQSSVRPAGVTIAQAAISEIAAESAAIRAQIAPELLVGTTTTIDLGQPDFLPLAYEAGTIAARGYDTRRLPNDDTLRADLDHFLGIYDAAVEARTSLTAQDPKRFYTPAKGTVPAQKTDAGGLFRPKDSADYVAQVAAQTQIRSRRHESVLKSFGEHARHLGWNPNTQVHPRDLTLRRADVDILCEVKVVRSNAEPAVREAIGQLFSYRHFLYEGVSPPPLLAVFSSAVGTAFVELLDELGIASVWATSATSWEGSASASALGVVA